MEFSENTGINKYIIAQIKGKQQLYRQIYALSLEELETLKAYIKNQLKTGFIRSFKSPARATIFFDKKPDGSFCLYVHY